MILIDWEFHLVTRMVIESFELLIRKQNSCASTVSNMGLARDGS